MTWTKCLSAEARDTIFDVLVHFVWADGRLAADEVAGARGAADALELSASAVSGQLITRAARPFESLALAGLAPLERPFAYGAAAWISMSDRRVSVSEHALLVRLREALGLSSPLAATIESWVNDERRDARHAPEHRLELDRVMSRILRHLVDGPDDVSEHREGIRVSTTSRRVARGGRFDG